SRAHAPPAACLPPARRRGAAANLDRLYIGVGYPDKWQNWGDLRIDSSDALGNARRIAERNRHQALARLTKPYDPHEWVLTPQTAGAGLIFPPNRYPFFAARPQPPH